MKHLIVLSLFAGCKSGFTYAESDRDIEVACGKCKNSTACEKSSGVCGNGCEPGWQGSLGATFLIQFLD